MSDLDRYLNAATRDNTRRSYRAAIEHFEVTWGGFLPATSDSVARYLVAHAGQLSINTLKLRLSAIAQWHNSQGFPDPTKAPVVRKVFKGIRALHPAQEKQAEPLQLQHLEKVVDWLEGEAQSAQANDDHPGLLRARRDAALILLGFWRGFRSDELCRLQVEHVQAGAGSGITLYLPRSKAIGIIWVKPFKRLHWCACVPYALISSGRMSRHWCAARYLGGLIAGAIWGRRGCTPTA